MRKVYFDIETIPSQEDWVTDYLFENTKPPNTIKKQESIDKWYEEKHLVAIQEALEKCSFDGAMNHIISIAFAIDDDEITTRCISDVKDEKALIEDFFDALNPADVLIGHNIIGFDLRVLKQRCFVLGLGLPSYIPFNAKPWDNNPFDTMMQWDAKNFISQDKLAKAFGIEGKKDDIDGSKVYQFWRDGKYKEIAEYCKNDVAMVRRIAKKMMRY